MAQSLLDIVSYYDMQHNTVIILHLQVTLDDPDDITCMTFVLKGEDHTLGNALRYMILKK